MHFVFVPDGKQLKHCQESTLIVYIHHSLNFDCRGPIYYLFLSNHVKKKRKKKKKKKKETRIHQQLLEHQLHQH